MHFVSTRGGPPVGLEQALIGGTAPDGGLYMAENLPEMTVNDFLPPDTREAVAVRLLAPFFAGSSLAQRLPPICASAFNFPWPLRRLESGSGTLSVLELFHGPTAAFKDVGARVLARCMEAIIEDRSLMATPGTGAITVLVATSGDTGGAVAAAYHQRPGVSVVVLFPEGRVSPRQQHQLTCWGGNVHSLAVRGEFDDCQRLVKAAFSDPALKARYGLCSANSINVGRLLPQMVYYAQASLDHWRETGRRLSFIVPTGNLGNAFAGVWTRRMGLPIGRIVLATNANTTIPDYLATGQWLPRRSVATLASAMDVGNPSNMERLQTMCGTIEALREEVSAVPVSDQDIRRTIVDEYRRHGQPWCPHTATGLWVYRQLSEDERRQQDWAVVATAHAAKFDTVVEPLLGIRVAPPEELSVLLTRPTDFATISPTLDELIKHL